MLFQSIVKENILSYKLIKIKYYHREGSVPLFVLVSNILFEPNYS